MPKIKYPVCLSAEERHMQHFYLHRTFGRLAAWEQARNQNRKGIDWQFTTDDARVKLSPLTSIDGRGAASPSVEEVAGKDHFDSYFNWSSGCLE